MHEPAIKEWLNLTETTRRNIFVEISRKLLLPEAAIEKDWWVVRTLELIFTTEVAKHTVFKGGTSLSKAWKLIDRFSEDIDLALDRKFLGFDGELNPTQVKRLRKESYRYIADKFYPLLQQRFIDAGFTDVRLQLRATTAHDQDPLIIEVYYPGITEQSEYLQPRVLIEIGSRSLREPFTVKEFRSLVGEQFSGRPFADADIAIPTVNPERTFLEKIFLLHEEFQKPAEKSKVDRLSRHLYDIEKIMDTEFAKTAFADQDLYGTIVAHRRAITPLRDVNYDHHIPSMINLIPPADLIEAWKKDYGLMQQSMITGQSLSFEKLIERIQLLKQQINQLPF